MMRRIDRRKMELATKVVVTQCENVLVRPWWRFWTKSSELRMVTRVIKDRMTGIHDVLKVRKLTELESSIFSEGDMHSYMIDYPPGVHCGS